MEVMQETKQAAIKAGIQIHTVYSPCSLTPLAALERERIRLGLHALAITDHDTIEGARAFQKLSSGIVIIGEEVSTTDGDLIGLFLHERIPPKLSAQETAERIKTQGGLVYVPHAFDFSRHALRPRALKALVPWIDAVEVGNSRTYLPFVETFAVRFAERHHKVQSCGSDAHTLRELRQAYVELEPFAPDDAQDFLRKLQAGRRVCRKTFPLFRGAATLRARLLHLLAPEKFRDAANPTAFPNSEDNE